jgi:selenocysteine lyase/cysteine desulfurase
LAEALKRRGIIVSARLGLLRVSPRFYNKVEEIGAFLLVLKEELRARD